MTILDQIIRDVKQEVKRRISEKPFDNFTPPRRKLSFIRAIHSSPKVPVIAEIKRASPSAGDIRPQIDIAEVAQEMIHGGAIGLSILTEPKYFKGNPLFLRKLAKQVEVPLLCKDFIVHPHQLEEATKLGADAVLLISGVLRKRILDFLRKTRALEMEALVEVTNERELEQALSGGADLIGINNRNLETMEIDLSRTERLAAKIPDGKTIVSESGINSSEDVKRVLKAGAHAVLVGTSIMRAPNIYEKVRELVEAKP